MTEPSFTEEDREGLRELSDARREPGDNIVLYDDEEAALFRALAYIEELEARVEGAECRDDLAARFDELAEKWLTRADHIDAANKPTDSNETRLIAVTKAGTLRDCARALSARVREPAPTVREDDEADHSRSVGVTECADTDIDAVSNLVAAHGSADHIAAMDRLIARAGEDDEARVEGGEVRIPITPEYAAELEARRKGTLHIDAGWAAYLHRVSFGPIPGVEIRNLLRNAGYTVSNNPDDEPAPPTLKGEDE